MKIVLMRKGSKGLEGTYINVEHHAKDVKHTIDLLVRVVKNNTALIKEWRQGHNIHYIELYDFRKLVFRPYKPENGPVIGVEVSISQGRHEVRLFTVIDPLDVVRFEAMLNDLKLLKENYYGKAEESTNV